MLLIEPIVLHENILYYENAVLNFSDIVERVEKIDQQMGYDDSNFVISKWSHWGASNDPDHTFGFQKTIKENLRGITDSFLYADSINIVLDIETGIRYCSKDYSKRTGMDIGTLLPMSISKYIPGAMMGGHVDSYDENGQETISLVSYLNDDYEGGEIEFPNQNVKIKPSAGSIIVFPSKAPFFHISHKVESGNKYISPAFWKKF
jgi:hypothetical protein